MHVNESFDNLLNLSKDEVKKFKFAPITSCDVERSFSVFKNILTDKRTNMSLDTLKMNVVCSQII